MFVYSRAEFLQHSFIKCLSALQWPVLWLWTQTLLILCSASLMTYALSHELKAACPALLMLSASTTGLRSSQSKPSPLGLTTGSWRLKDSGMSLSAIEPLEGREKKAMRLETTRFTDISYFCFRGSIPASLVKTLSSVLSLVTEWRGGFRNALCLSLWFVLWAG